MINSWNVDNYESIFFGADKEYFFWKRRIEEFESGSVTSESDLDKFYNFSIDISDNDYVKVNVNEGVSNGIGFVCPDLLYIDHDILDEIGYNDDVWGMIIYMNNSKDVFDDKIILSNEMRLAMLNIKKNNLTWDDLIILKMHPENLEKIGNWINNYINTNQTVKDDFIQGLYNYIRTLGYSHVYAKNTIESILNDMRN